MARHRRLVAVLALVVAAVGAGWGTGVFAKLVTGGFEDPGSLSAHANARIAREVGGQSPDVLVLYSSRNLTATGQLFRQDVEQKARRIAELPGVAGVITAYDGRPGLISSDGHATYAVIRLSALDDSGKRSQYNAIKAELDIPGLRSQVGGTVAVDDRIDGLTKSDVTRGEMVAMPLVLLLLVFIFGGVVAASLPLAIGLLAILGAFTVTHLFTLVTHLSTFAANTITVLGLGMAIDYSLLMVNRFREELGQGAPAETAVARAVSTAGRTVLISGLLVVLSLASLLIFPEVFLRSMAIGGMAAVLVAMLSALTVLPAVLAMLGHRVNAWHVPRPRRRRPRLPAGAGPWERLSRSVMRRPVRYVTAVVVVLAVLAAPLWHVRFGSVDERVLPAGDPVRSVSEQIAAEFSGRNTAPISVLIDGASPEQVRAVRDEVASLPHVRGALVADQRVGSALIAAEYAGGFAGADATAAVAEIRSLHPPAGVQVMVGGDTATIHDEMTSLSDRFPWMLLLMAVVTFLVLLLAFGSLLLPIKAVLTNVVSIAATFGALVWTFQDGHLANLLGVTTTGHLEPTVLILVLAELFGLATDYEVFLLSRIKEQWDGSGDNTFAVASGLQRTGRIITAAAALLIIVTAGFATGQIVLTKLIGIGTALGIFLDATLIRVVLVPATMRLLGRWNWWAPRPVIRLAGRINLDAPAEPDAAGVLTLVDTGRG